MSDDDEFVPFSQPVPHREVPKMDEARVAAVAQFLLKLLNERVNEAKNLYKAGDREEVKVLVAEGELLRDAHTLIRGR